MGGKIPYLVSLKIDPNPPSVRLRMEPSHQLLKNEQYVDNDLDFSDNEAAIKDTYPLGRPALVSRLLRYPILLHLLLIVGYTICYMWLGRSRFDTGCAQRDLIYCNNAQDTEDNQVASTYIDP